jgi:hypothetical protein
MKSKLFVSLYATLILFIPLTLSVSTASASSACDPAFLTMIQDEIIVSPTGIDDTANLQCAFDEATAGTTVRLLPGTFITQQIIVHDFHGQFTGAGDSRTTIVNLPEMFVTPVGFYEQLPSPERPWPTLIAFLGGNFSISDLAIHITGANPTTGWKYTDDIDEPVNYRLAHAITILGSEANVEISKILISGERVDNPDYGLNLFIGVMANGNLEGYSGSFRVLNSSFMLITNPIRVMAVSNTSVVISHNQIFGGVYGTWGTGFTDSSLEISHNKIQNYIGIYLSAPEESMDSGNTFLISNNVLDTDWGVALDTIFGEGNECLLLGNAIQYKGEDGVGIALGDGIYGCIVVGSSVKTNVWDLSGNNILVGVNNMGTGIGPSIRDLLKELR